MHHRAGHGTVACAPTPASGLHVEAGRQNRVARTMVSIDEAARMAMALPDVTTGTWHGNRTWLVGRTAFAWQRPFSKADLRRFGATPVPTGLILAVRVADLRAK